MIPRPQEALDDGVAIRQGKLDEVAAILDKKPELIACLAKAPPKKDDGQSPLMVAIKSDHLEAAHLRA